MGLQKAAAWKAIFHHLTLSLLISIIVFKITRGKKHLVQPQSISLRVKMPRIKRFRIWHSFLVILLFLFISPKSSHSAALKLMVTETDPSLHIVLEIDKVEQLAGLKISATYPESVLKYESATKTKATSSFMHVVNDKLPGKLTIVMASAQGISGSNVALLDLNFSVLSGKTVTSSSIKITHCQLMTENLKELPCNTNM